MICDAELTCSKCHSVKPLCEFADCASRKSGKRGMCRCCNRAYQKRYKLTPEGWANCAFANIEARVENRSGKDKSYANVRNLFTHDTFLAWAVPAYIAFRSQYPHDVASIDRIDPDGNYQLGNVRVLPWRENSRLARRKLARRVKASLGLPWINPKPRGVESVAVLLEVSPVLTSPNKYAQRLRQQQLSQKPPQTFSRPNKMLDLGAP